MFAFFGNKMLSLHGNGENDMDGHPITIMLSGEADSFQWNLLPSVCFLGHGSGGIGSGHARYCEKD